MGCLLFSDGMFSDGMFSDGMFCFVCESVVYFLISPGHNFLRIKFSFQFLNISNSSVFPISVIYAYDSYEFWSGSLTQVQKLISSDFKFELYVIH